MTATRFLAAALAAFRAVEAQPSPTATATCLGCPAETQQFCTTEEQLRCGSVTIYDDDDVAAWLATTNGDGSGCEVIGGDLTISQLSVTAEGLAALAPLVKVCGSLTIQQLRLGSLDGLDNLAFVGGNVKVEQNAWGSTVDSEYVTDVSSLAGLDYVGGALTVQQNFHITAAAQLAAAFSGVNVFGSVTALYYPGGTTTEWCDYEATCVAVAMDTDPCAADSASCQTTAPPSFYARPDCGDGTLDRRPAAATIFERW